MSFGRSKPAAFLTTLAPPRTISPRPSTKGHREQEIPQAAVAQPAGAVGPRGHGAADRAAGADQQRIERQILAFGGESSLDFGERRPGQRGHGVLARQVLGDATERRHIEHFGAVNGGQRRLRAAAARNEQLRTAYGLGNLGRRTRLMDDAGHKSPGPPLLTAPPRLIRAR